MSKGSKRHSAAYNDQLWSRLFRPEQIKPGALARAVWLDMDDAEIDRVYWQIGAADRADMKKLAAVERLRKVAMAVLEEERRDGK